MAVDSARFKCVIINTPDKTELCYQLQLHQAKNALIRIIPGWMGQDT